MGLEKKKKLLKGTILLLKEGFNKPVLFVRRLQCVLINFIS